MKKQVITITIIMTMTMIINNMAHPVTPEMAIQLNFSSFTYGAIFAAMSLSNFLMSPVWGSLSDKYGRKKFMIIGPIGYAFSQLGFGLSTNAYMIIFFRFLAGGIASASFVCGMAYLIDVTNRNERSKIMVVYTAITGFGANLGFLLGGFIGNSQYQYAFIAQAILSFLSAFVILFVLKESKKTVQIVKKQHIIRDFLKYTDTILPILLVVTVLSSFLMIGFNTGFNFMLKSDYGLFPIEIGIIMAIIGSIGLFTNLVIFPFVKRRYNDYYILIASIFILGLSLSLVTYIKTLDIQVVILIVFFAVLALHKPLLQSFISKTGENNGEIMGLNNTFHAIGMVLGSLYTGWIFDMNRDMAFYSLAIIGLLAFVILFFKRKSLLEYT